MSECSSSFSEFKKRQYLSLETLRRSGEPVRTPVWFACDNDTIYIRTLAKSGKAKRMKNNPRVRVAPSDYSGTSRGEWVEAEARAATEDESRRAVTLLNMKYNFQKWVIDIFSKIVGREYMIFVLRPI